MAVNSKAGNIGYTTWTFWPPKSDTYIIDSFDGVINGSSNAGRLLRRACQSVFQAELAPEQGAAPVQAERLRHPVMTYRAALQGAGQPRQRRRRYG